MRVAFHHALSVSLALLFTLLRAVARQEEPGLAKALAKEAAASDLGVVAAQLKVKGEVLAHVRLLVEIGFPRARNSKNFSTFACRAEAGGK
jgi:hypothetical protein